MELFNRYVCIGKKKSTYTQGLVLPVVSGIHWGLGMYPRWVSGDYCTLTTLRAEAQRGSLRVAPTPEPVSNAFRDGLRTWQMAGPPLGNRMLERVPMVGSKPSDFPQHPSTTTQIPRATGKGQLALRLNPPQTPLPAWDRRERGTAPWAPPISFHGFLLYPVPSSYPHGLGEGIRSKEWGRGRGVISNCNGIEHYQQKPWEGTSQLSNT